MKIVIDLDFITPVRRLISKLRRISEEEKLEAEEADRKAFLRSFRTDQIALLERAAMDIYQLNTGVIRSTDGVYRIAVRSAVDNGWGDCASIQIMSEAEPGIWRFFHLSPAKARILAADLLFQANRLEVSEPSSMFIDKPVQKTPVGIIA